MSTAKLQRRLGRLQASNRIKAHAQREAAEAIAQGRYRWVSQGAADALAAMTRVIVPKQDERRDRPTLLNKKPEHPVLMVPILGNPSASFADYAPDPRAATNRVARFEYRPMEARIMSQSIVWWDIVPMDPVRDRQSLADDVLRVCDDLRDMSRYVAGARSLSGRLDCLVARMRLAAREEEHERRASP